MNAHRLAAIFFALLPVGALSLPPAPQCKCGAKISRGATVDLIFCPTANCDQGGAACGLTQPDQFGWLRCLCGGQGGVDDVGCKCKSKFKISDAGVLTAVCSDTSQQIICQAPKSCKEKWLPPGEGGCPIGDTCFLCSCE